MINITLCDDSKEIIEMYSKIIKQIAEKNNFNVIIHSYYKGEALVFDLEDKKSQSSIYILDMHMDKLNGIETAREIRKFYPDAKIIFLTVNSQYVFESFDVMPMNYFLKDNLEIEKLESTLLRAINEIKEDKDIFTFEARKNIRYIKMSTIMFFEVNKRVITVTCSNGQRESFYSSIEKIEEELKNKNFIRVHRSFVANLRYIRELKGNKLTMANNESIPVGIKYSKTVRKIYSEYLINKAMINI